MASANPTMKQRIADDMKTAMREKNAVTLETVRMLRAAIQRKELDDQTEVDDDGVLLITQKLVKQAKDSIEQFTIGGREDLVEKEALSLSILEAYLPEQFDDAAIADWVKQAIVDTGASEKSDMGKVMGWLKPKIQGQADMSKVSTMVRDQLK